MKELLFVVAMFSAMLMGYSIGYRKGNESVNFNMAHANDKLEDCQELIYAKR